VTEPAPPRSRRAFVAVFGWTLGVAGLGVAGFTLVRSTQPGGFDPRVSVELPERGDGYVRTLTMQGRPIGIRGLSMVQAAELNLAPGAPPFMIVDRVCTYDHCVVGVAPDRPDAPWSCPCCGQTYGVDGRRLSGPARHDLGHPLFSFAGRRTVLIGPRFQAT